MVLQSFDNEAAPGDSIYDEIVSFDDCEGYPANMTCHYHAEPTSITQSNSSASSFVGVLKDGIPVYGRTLETSSPTLDSEGGQTYSTEDSSVSLYHYHVHYQTDGGSNSAYFITSGTYKGPEGTCSGC